jgi:small subunit ribosomal protein S1
LVLDIGAKSEGLVAEKAFEESKEFIKGLKIGDIVKAHVIVGETPDGFSILSLRRAAQEASWKKLKKAKSKGTPVVVLGKGVNPSGVIVRVGGLTGFIPGSQIGKEALKNPSKLVGKSFKAHIIELDPSANKIVLSEKLVSDKEDVALIKAALEKIKQGEIYEGEVTTVSSFGCFVRIKLKVDGKDVDIEGLVHVSELSWEMVTDPNDVVSEGEKIKVKVIGKKDPLTGSGEVGRLALSIKQAQEDPWEKAAKKYKKDKRVKGKVVKISDFGVFVSLEPGVDGLIHMTKIPPGKRLEKGQEVNVYIEEIDAKARKLSLGLVLTEKPVGYK